MRMRHLLGKMKGIVFDPVGLKLSTGRSSGIRQILWLSGFVLFLALFAPSGLSAAPVYYIVHSTDTYCCGITETAGPQDSPVSYSFSGETYFITGVNTGEVQAHVDQGSVGIYASTHNNGAYAPQRQEVTAGFLFDVVFGSAGTDPVNVIMNLELSGIISPSDNYSTVGVRAGLLSGPFAGAFSEIVP